MRFEHQEDLKFSLIAQDDGELPTSILEQFPSAVIRRVDSEVGTRPVGLRRSEYWHNDTAVLVDMVALGLIMIATTAINLVAVFLWIDSW